jgi:hypothetical protein
VKVQQLVVGGSVVVGAVLVVGVSGVWLLAAMQGSSDAAEAAVRAAQQVAAEGRDSCNSV